LPNWLSDQPYGLAYPAGHRPPELGPDPNDLFNEWDERYPILSRSTILPPNPPLFPMVPYVSPIKVPELVQALTEAGYDDIAFIKDTFTVGADLQLTLATPTNNNHTEFKEANPEDERLKDEYVKQETLSGRYAGPFPSPPFTACKVQPLFVIHQPPKSRVCNHASWPPSGGSSTNASIPKIETHYLRFQHLITMIAMLGIAAQLVVIDIKNAYRLVPTRMADWWCTVILHKGLYYVDKCCNFGTSSAVRIWIRVARSFRFLINVSIVKAGISHRVVRSFVDDFLLAIRKADGSASFLLQLIIALLDKLGIPHGKHQAGEEVIFIGIGINSNLLAVFLPEKKRIKTISKIDLTLASLTSAEEVLFASLLGTLSHVCTIIPQIRTWLRLLWIALKSIDAKRQARSPRDALLRQQRRVDLSGAVYTRLMMIKKLVSSIKHNTYLPIRHWDLKRVHIFGDASKLYAGGFETHSLQWVRYPSPTWLAHERISSNLREAVVILILVISLKHLLKGTLVILHSDNLHAVHSYINRGSRIQAYLSIIMAIEAVAAEVGFYFLISHVDGKKNPIADDISRCKSERLVRMANPFLSSRIPAVLSFPAAVITFAKATISGDTEDKGPTL
jgi:hypothetical protein